MKRPRRIFRSSASRRSPLLRTVLAAVAGTLGVAVLTLAVLSSNLFGRATPAPAHIASEPGGTAVVDGDTLRLAGYVVRLRGVAAPDRGDHCRGDIDCGGAAASALASFVRGRRVECALADHDSVGRPYAACDANGTDLSRAIVASGWARALPGAPELADLELRARRQRAGLWAGSVSH